MKKQLHSLFYIKIFLATLFLASLVSLSYKMFVLIKDSYFKHDSFNLLVEGRFSYLVHLDKKEKKISIIDFSDQDEIFKNKNRISSSLFVGIPIDGRLTYDVSDKKELLSPKIILNVILTPAKHKFENVNQFDLLKFLFFSSLVPESDKVYSSKVVSDLFRDREIINEKISIEVINSTETDGLGGKIGKMLETAGYNIISISTGGEKKSQITTRRKESTTVQKLHNFFGIEIIESENPGIADVSLNIGQDLTIEPN